MSRLRRGVLAGMVLLAAFATGSLPQADGQSSIIEWREEIPVRSAFHLHGSASEGTASIAAHRAELVREGFDVGFITDHDWRRRAFGAQELVSFDSLDGERYGPGDINPPWQWRRESHGDLAEDVVAISQIDNPSDESEVESALRVVARSDGGLATTRVFANTSATRNANRVSLAGQRIEVGLMPRKTSVNGWLELTIGLSYHPAMEGRAPGQYFLNYRFMERPASRSLSDDGFTGAVDVEVSSHVWQDVILNPTEDIARLWPEMVAEDNSLHELWVGATSRNGAKASGHFSHLRFLYDAHDGQTPNVVARSIIDAYESRWPSFLRMYVGEEISQGGLHLNQYGVGPDGRERLIVPVYPAGTEDHARQEVGRDVMAGIVTEQIHPAGGLVSLNHMFGTREGATLPPSQMRAQTREVAADLVDAGMYDVDVAEFGYNKRGGADLEEHLHLMEIMLRNGFFFTANGVSDDHGARANSIDRINNPMATFVWADSNELVDVLTGLRQGRAFVANFARFSGVVDLAVDGHLTGSIVVDTAEDGPDQAELTVYGKGLGDNGYVEVLQGAVEPPGATTAVLEPATRVIAVIDNTTLNTEGAVHLPMSVDGSSYVYLRMHTITPRGEDFLTGFTNPVWYLRQEPDLAARHLTAGRQVERLTHGPTTQPDDELHEAGRETTTALGVIEAHDHGVLPADHDHP